MNAGEGDQPNKNGANGAPKAEGEEEKKIESTEQKDGMDKIEGSKEKKVEECDDRSKVMAVKVLTKVEDGGTVQLASTENNVDEQQATDNNAFQRYSNTNVRMTHLLGLDEEDPDVANEDNTDWRQITGYEGRRVLRQGVADNDENTRKTRLSTELHADVFRNIPHD